MAGRRDFSSYLVSPEEFVHESDSSNISAPVMQASRIVPVCAAWFMPNDPEKRTGLQSYKAGRIPGARFFDIDGIKDEQSSYPHMLPSRDLFARAMGKLGLKNDDTIVVYDTAELGIFSAPRVAWTLKAFGHERVHILNNFKEYVRLGYPVVTDLDSEPVDAENYNPPGEDFPRFVADYDYMRQVAQGRHPEAVALDARPAGRFDGTTPEPRPGLSSGHMPRSVSVQFTDLLDPKSKKFLPKDQLKTIFEQKGVYGKNPVISSCGTGVTAAIIDTALAEAGLTDDERMLYDGSWTEWAQRATAEEGLIVKRS